MHSILKSQKGNSFWDFFLLFQGVPALCLNTLYFAKFGIVFVNQKLMKKLFLFFLLLSQSVLMAQTVLNSLPLQLNDPSENGQILNVEDVKTHNVYAFTADDQKINILKYNKSLFLTNRYTDSIRSEEDRILLGYSISEDENPTLYWSAGNSRNIRIIKYFLETRKSRALNFDFPPNVDYIITKFQQQNIFYILAKEKNEPNLVLFAFNNGVCEIKMFDFSAISMQNHKGQNFSFTTLLRYHPLQKMDADNFNSLDKTSSLNKMYLLDGHIMLTLDYNINKTQVLDLNIETGAIQEKNFDKPISKKSSKTSNSFYNEGKLFQINSNSEEFVFDIKDFETGKTIKNVYVTKNDTIRFKNSPLFLQTNNSKPQEIKTTAKFLKNLSGLRGAISVFKNHQNTYITFGGYAEYMASEFLYSKMDILDDFISPDMQSQYLQTKTVFFDAVLNADFEFVTKQNEPLAIDNIYYYLSINKNIALENILKLQDYYILSYYDTALKQFMMRKFTDGFIDENPGNPVINKLLLSKPATFGKLKFIEN